MERATEKVALSSSGCWISGYWEMGECPNGHPNSMLRDTFRTDKRGNPRVGKRCAECRRIYDARYRWSKRNPGAPIPDDLRLATDELTA